MPKVKIFLTYTDNYSYQKYVFFELSYQKYVKHCVLCIILLNLLLLLLLFFWVYWIALLQAILGGTIQVPTLTGDVVLKVCLKFVYD